MLEPSADGTSAHGVNEMARAHTTHEGNCNSPARRYSSALLLLVIAGLLIACGGGGGSSTSPNTAVLAWDAETVPVSGYRIYYGTAPGTYLQSVGQGLNVGDVTTFTVTGLSSGTRYFFAATAYDASGESAFSNEVFKDIP